MARISPETIGHIRTTADIVDVVSQYVNMKKRGRNYFGLCPFHDERTPSFSVAPEKEIYHCFGCGAGGNVFNFIMEHDNLTFVEAVQILGQRYGIEVKLTGDSGTKQLFTQLYDIHEMATSCYRESLFSKPGKAALQYLRNRGLSDETIHTFRIGFSPKSWDHLTKTVRGQGFSQECIKKSGLFGQSQQGPVDRFRSRIMFPIMNRSGRVIAFGGRAFASDDPAKYMNSPETPLYRKSEVFYGYHQTAPAIRSANGAILVEGYMDFLQLYQGGLDNVLAVSGTAFTGRHAAHIGKITSRIYCMYDGDEAGRKAAVRAGYALLQNGIAAFVVSVPEGMDPDDWLLKAGPDAVRAELDQAQPLLQFHLQMTDAIDLSAVERSSLVNDILREIAAVRDGIIRDDLLKTLVQAFQLDEVELVQRLKQARRQGTRRETIPVLEPQFTASVDKAQVEILQMLVVAFQEVWGVVRDHLDLFSAPLLRQAASLLLDHRSDIAAVLEKLTNKTERQTVARILMQEGEIDKPLAVVYECLRHLQTQPLKDQISRVRNNIRVAEAAGEDSSTLISEVGQLQKQLRTLSDIAN